MPPDYYVEPSEPAVPESVIERACQDARKIIEEKSCSGPYAIAVDREVITVEELEYLALVDIAHSARGLHALLGTENVLLAGYDLVGRIHGLSSEEARKRKEDIERKVSEYFGPHN